MEGDFGRPIDDLDISARNAPLSATASQLPLYPLWSINTYNIRRRNLAKPFIDR